MTLHYLILALVLQASLICADSEENEAPPTRDVLNNTVQVDADVEKATKLDWIDMFLQPSNIYPSPSAAMMAQITNSENSPEEQLEDIKEMANRITMAIQSEMANLLSYALANSDKDVKDNKLRKRRSVESPMDSTQLVMRLLRHIKNNNEYQNIAIEKMMTAQEIADKYGIDFNPDSEMLSDLTIAANEQAKELTSILKETSDARNITKEEIRFIPMEKKTILQKPVENDTYYIYAMHYPEELVSEQNVKSQAPAPKSIYNSEPAINHIHYSETYPHCNYYNNYPYETQVVAPPTHPRSHHYSVPVTQKLNFYDFYEPFTPAVEYHTPYCSMEPITTTATFVLPFEEPVEPEPKIVGEEMEETISNKVFVDHEEPGTSTVNHVMTYTVSEKSHFKTPQTEQLPQQMQYSFFLI